MNEYVPFIGDTVYIYSSTLDEVIEGIVEGYADEDKRRYKILQDISIEGESVLRHIVSYIYVFKTYEEAAAYMAEYQQSLSKDLVAGNIVYLLDSHRHPVLDKNHVPCQYQVVAVYRDTNRVSLVTSYGEHIGTYDISEVHYIDEGPLFKKDDYVIGDTVIWAEGEEVYEGTISHLYDTSAKINNLKKLLPIDKSVRIPYWKIPEGRKSNREYIPHVLHTIIGDDLD